MKMSTQVVTQNQALKKEYKILAALNNNTRKPIRSKLETLQGATKLHESLADDYSLFTPIFAAIHIPTSSLTKYFVPIVKSLLMHDCALKDSFELCKHIL